MTKAQTHFYGSTAYGWRTGATVEEVLKGLASDVGKTSIKNAVSLRGGLQAYTCKVHAPASANYEIRKFMPHGVECSEFVDFLITSEKGAHKRVENAEV